MMDAVDQTLQATERLLKALQEDRSTLGDSSLADRLTDLRTKHRETTEYLSRLWEEESRYHSVPHTTCRQWAVHHCPSERATDSCPNDYNALSRQGEFVIHHRPSEYTIHHRPSEYTIHHRPRGYTEEHYARQTMDDQLQTDYPGPPRPSEFTVYRSSGDFVGDYRSREFSLDQRLTETSVQHIRSEFLADSFPTGYPRDHPLTEYPVQNFPGVPKVNNLPPKVQQNSRSGEYFLKRPTECAKHLRREEHLSRDLPPEYLQSHLPAEELAQQGPSGTSHDQYSSDVSTSQVKNKVPLYSSSAASAALQRSMEHSLGDLLPEYLSDHFSEDSLRNSPKRRGQEDSSANRRQSASATRHRPKASSAHPRLSEPTIPPRLRDRVASLPTRPTAQDAADMLHLSTKVKLKKRKERAQNREKEKILEKVDESSREEPAEAAEEGHSKEEFPANGDRTTDDVREASDPKEKRNGGEVVEKVTRKSDKEGGPNRETSSKRNGRVTIKEKAKDDSFKRVEFTESKPSKENVVVKDDREGAEAEKLKDQGGDPTPFKPRPPRPKSAKGIRESKKPEPHPSTTKRDVVPEPIQNFVPQITVPVPFKFSTRKPIINRYSKKFLDEMISKRREEEEEEENKGHKAKPFTAQAVPKSTYVSTNPLVSDKAYVEAIRRRLTAVMRKHFEQEALSRRSKSMGDLTVRPVPITTYVAPVNADYRRSRSTHRRAVQLLVEATTPPFLREHTIRTHVSAKVRHLHCLDDQTEYYPRPPIPDFQRMHAEMENALKNAPHKPTTVPQPFHLTDPKAFRHRQCKSSSPPRWRAQNARKVSKGGAAVRQTHSSTIRMEAIRQRQKELDAERHRSEKFWEDRRDEMDLSRLKLLSSMGSLPNVNDEIEKKTAEKIKRFAETTRNYEAFLAEMQQRVIERPLIMERQSIIAQKQKFNRKYEERLAAVGKKSTSDRKERHDSDVSGGTYSVKSKGHAEMGENEYGSGSFESEEEVSGSKKRSASISSSSVSSSSSTASSKSSSPKKSHSSAASETSSSEHETKI
uniref:JmjC domain-containing protein n=1 Tax=Haemonchus contortus TaxID=6289 RepID=A0A7I4YU64_HAECO